MRIDLRSLTSVAVGVEHQWRSGDRQLTRVTFDLVQHFWAGDVPAVGPVSRVLDRLPGGELRRPRAPVRLRADPAWRRAPARAARRCACGCSTSPTSTPCSRRSRRPSSRPAIARLAAAPPRHVAAHRRAADHAAAGGVGIAGRRGAGCRDAARVDRALEEGPGRARLVAAGGGGAGARPGAGRGRAAAAARRCSTIAHDEVRAAAVEASGTSAIRGACRRCCGRCPTPRATSGPASSSRSASWGRASAHALVAHARAPPRRSGDSRRADRLHRRGQRPRRPAGVVEPRRPHGAGRGAAGAGLARPRRPRLLLRAARARRRERRGAGDGRPRARAIAARATRRHTWRSTSATNGWSPPTPRPRCACSGPAGERELAARQDAPGLTGVLARQMLWERRARPEAGGSA